MKVKTSEKCFALLPKINDGIAEYRVVNKPDWLETNSALYVEWGKPGIFHFKSHYPNLQLMAVYLWASFSPEFSSC